MQLHLFNALLSAAAVVALPATAAGIVHRAYSASEIAETVTVRTVELEFPTPGEFLVEGMPAASPVATIKVRGFRIMKQQVGAADYSSCVADGACDPADGAVQPGANVPVAGVSYLDAAAFADWYSRKTGYPWRLPTAEEAAAAAGKRFAGDTSSAVPDDPANPAVAWLRRYREGAAQKRPADPIVKARGFYGTNANGLQDFGGNVWEWTSTCYARTTLTTGGAVDTTTEYCGVRVLEGRHRAYMSNFVRDGKSGGCAVGTPPEHLGFRLVRDGSPFARARLVAMRLWTLTTGSWPAIGSQPATKHSGKD